MPKKVIGVELTQEDYHLFSKRIAQDLKGLDVTCTVHLEANNWLAVNASCGLVIDGDYRTYSTHVTYVTERGPHLMTVMCRHMSSLYMIVDRALSNLPPPIGF